MTKLTHSYSAIKLFEQCALRYKYQRIDKMVDKGGAASIYGNRIHDQLEHRLKEPSKHKLPAESSNYEMLCQAFESMPGELYAEKELTLNESLKPTGWWDEDAWLRSKLDILVLNGDEALIADWKTGKFWPDMKQLDMFALQVFTHYKEVNHLQASFIWLKDLKLTNRKYTRADAPYLWRDLMERIQRIVEAKDKNVWPARPSGLCKYCPANGVCAYA